MQSNNSVQSFEDISFLNLSKETIDAICCPVSLFPYKKAQVVNCDGYHSFSLESVLKIFGEMKKVGNENQCEKPGSCPLCRGRVTSYPIPALQSLVDSILGVEKGEVHIDKMYEIIRKLKIDFDRGDKYPLQKENFNFDLGDFQQEGGCVNLINSLGRGNIAPGHIEKIFFSIEDVYLTINIFLSDKNSTYILHEYLKKRIFLLKNISMDRIKFYNLNKNILKAKNFSLAYIY